MAVRRRTKKAVRKGARRPAAKPRRAAAKPGGRRVAAKKRVTRHAAPRAAAAKKRAPAAKRTASRKPAPAARSRAKAGGAPTRATTLAALRAGRDALLAAVRGLDATAAERPIAPGKWSPKQVVLHMAFWDEWMLGVLPAAIGRERRPEPLTPERVDELNALAVESGAALGWNEVKALFASQRSLLLAMLAAVPAAPAARWTSAHALGEVIGGYWEHDLQQAAKIRAARRAPGRGFQPAFAEQKAAANPKELLLFELQRARVAVMAAIQGLPAGVAMQPITPGKWTPHEIILHLAVRDRVRLEAFGITLGGTPAPWMLYEESQYAGENETHLAELRHLTWDDAVRLLQNMRGQLLAALLAVPDEPAEVWTEAHPFGAMIHRLPPHDLHHAEQIKNARVAG